MLGCCVGSDLSSLEKELSNAAARVALRVTAHGLQGHSLAGRVPENERKAAWAVMVPANKLSKIPSRGMWHIYPLEPPFKTVILVAPATRRREASG
jgi:hypothetical protein